MKASVIIPTYNRAEKIGNLLDSLVNQTVNDFEVIVVVDGSTDNTVEVVEPYKNRFTQFKLIVNQNQGRSKTKNAGARSAFGDLFIFYDDDMLPSPDSIKKHYEFHLQNGMNAILGGNQVEYEEPQKTDIQNYIARIRKKWTTKYIDGINTISLNNLFLSAANFSIPKQIFNSLNGFDERLNDIEDYEFAYRAISKGIPLFFDKTNIAIHNDPITCETYLNRRRQYSQAQARIITLIGNIPLSQKRNSFQQKLMYWIFSFPVWIKIIDGNFLSVLPKKMRYLIYDKVLHAQSVVFYN